MNGQAQHAHGDYTVAWICALPLEMAAAKLMIDNIRPKLPQPRADHNTYVLGDVAGHNVVIACLPSGIYGTTSAALVADQLLATFPSIRFGLMVGIGGGVPDKQPDIQLGDIVVGKPTDTFNGVVQYDYGKTVAGGKFERTGALCKPPQVLLTAISHLQSNHMIGLNLIPHILEEACGKATVSSSLLFQYPGPMEDRLFEATYEHQSGHVDCSACDRAKLVLNRSIRQKYHPQVHYGLVASGNQVMKHGETRSRLARELPILCFEMEAAGLMDHFPCLVVRGICDYADTHKQKHWQGYAALTAAAYAKELLSEISVNQAPEYNPVANHVVPNSM
jgi:nucleoside phosphorylase